MVLRPTKWLVRLVGLWALLGVSAAWWLPAGLYWRSFGYAVLGIAVLDAVFLLVSKKVSGKRVLPGRFALGVQAEVTVRLSNLKRRAVWVSMYDGVPECAESDLLPWYGMIRGRGFSEVNYPVTLMDRGPVEFYQIHLLEMSFLQLWARRSLI